MKKYAFALTLISSLVACAWAAEPSSASDPNANVAGVHKIKNPARVSIALPTRQVKDRNGNVIFNAPVPLNQKKEVKVSSRKPVTTRKLTPSQQRQQNAQKSSNAKRGSVNSTLAKARAEREIAQREKKLAIAKAAEHKFKEPSKQYVEAFADAKIKALGTIYLMKDSVKALIDKYPKACRFLPVDKEVNTQVGSIVCENTPKKVKNAKGVMETTYPLGSGPVRVYFQYLISNDLLVGVDYEFEKEKDAKAKYTEFSQNPVVKADFFVEQGGNAVDSPFWRVSHGSDFGRYWARVATNFDEMEFVEDENEKRKAEHVQLGNLTLNKTLASEMPETTADCRLLGIDKEENMYEYYGSCFAFKGTAHYTMFFDEGNRLETFILRPDSIGALADMSSYLASRFGVGKRCKISAGDSLKTLVKEDITALDFKFTYVMPYIPNAVVYAGTCERPFIYESPRRLYFTNRMIQASKLEDSYHKRKLRNQTRIEREEERAIRKSGIREYFNK